MSKKLAFFLLTLLILFELTIIILQAGKDSSFDIQNTAIQITKSCQNNLNKNFCYQKSFADLSQKQDITKVAETLALSQQIDPKLKFCHTLAHKVAINEVTKNPAKWLDIFQKVDPDACASGFFHGIIEGHARFNPEFSLSARTITEICNQISQDLQSEEVKLSQTRCAHAMGHIIPIQVDGDIISSISICSGLDSFISYYCFVGVFMENINKSNLIAHGLAEPEINKHQNISQYRNNCAKYTDQQSEACWEVLGDSFAQVNNYDYQKVYSDCQHAPKQESRFKCYIKGIRYMLSAELTGASHVEKLSSYCEPVKPSNSYFECINSILINQMEGKFTDKMLSVCENVNKNYKNECYRTIYQRMGKYYSDIDQKSICSKMPGEYSQYCMEQI